MSSHNRPVHELAKETVSRRLNSQEGISYTEFSYQVLQGMDFLELYRRHGCTLQTGGSDQWGNLTAGTELIRKVEGVKVHALATPLITKSDGTKFGKTEGGAVWLAPDMMSPYAFYQFWLNQDDADVVKLLKVFTFLTREEIEALGAAVESAPFRREAQRTLAWEVTSLVHGRAAAQGAVDASLALFGHGELGALDAVTLEGCAQELRGVRVGVGAPVVDALVEAGVVDSKSAARRAIQDGGAYVNNVKVTAADATLRPADALAGGWFVLRRGKKTIGLVRPSS